MIIEKGRVRIISASGEESELASLFQKEEDLLNLTEVRSYPEKMPLEFIFKVDSGNDTIGEVRLKNIRWYNRKAELSIFLRSDYRSKGFGSEILKEVLRFVFFRMNLHRVEAEVNQSNRNASRLLEALGFKQEGILREAKYLNGAYEDIVRYGLLKEEYLSMIDK